MNFLLSQTHRLWLSSKLIVAHSTPSDSIIDFGSFPFFVPLSLRDYFSHRGTLTATCIQQLADDHRDFLSQYGIDTDILDLDPHVIDFRDDRIIPHHLRANDESQDVALLLHVIEHLYHPLNVLKEANRVLRTGGHLIVTTDNAMMLNTLLNYISGCGFISEPIQQTAAMVVHDWRGHVRFFTADDLRTIVESCGFRVKEVGFEEVFYEVFHEEYFLEPRPVLSNWRKRILRHNRCFANDVYLVAEKYQTIVDNSRFLMRNHKWIDAKASHTETLSSALGRFSIPLVTVDREGKEVSTYVQIKSHNAATISFSDARVLLQTDPRQWSFSAEAAVSLDPSCKSHLILVEVEVSEGELGVGWISADRVRWVTRTSAKAGDGAIKLQLSLSQEETDGCLIFDNWTPSNKPAIAVLHSITIIGNR